MASRRPEGLRRRTLGARVCQWIEAYCVIPDGPEIGQPFAIPEFWRRIIYEWYELMPDGHGGWRRRYSEGLIGIPKKNIKTSISAAMALYELAGSEDPAALVLSAAASEKQGSNLLYGSAKTMAEQSEALKGALTAYEHAILVPSQPRARMVNVASRVGPNDGANARAVFVDELHEWKGENGRSLYTVLQGSLVSRPDATLLAITTAGHDEDSICHEKFTYGRGVEDGSVQDPRFYFRWIDAPEAADHTDRKVWAVANPLLGITVHESVLEDRVRRIPESEFRRYHLNQWVAGETIWIPYGAWDACQSPLDLDPALPAYVGIDMARTIDSSARAICQRIDQRPLTCPLCGEVGVTFAAIEEGEGAHCSACGELVLGPPPEWRYVLRVTIWSNPYPESDPMYEQWVMNPHLVIEDCRDLFKRFPVPACAIDDVVMPGPLFAYDPWRFRAEADQLTGEGLAMVELPQTDQRMIPASQTFYEAIMRGLVAHNGDPALKRHVQSVTAEQRDRGWRISKPKGSKRKIDGAVAAAIALYHAMTTPPPAPRRSVYEDRGIRVIG